MNLNKLSMQKDFFINQEVGISNFTYIIGTSVQCCSKETNKARGIKKIENHITIYLIELLNHNRIWIMQQELK